MEKSPTTATEAFIADEALRRFIRTTKALELVLDFVERHNKFDKEVEVADAAEYLRQTIIPLPRVKKNL